MVRLIPILFLAFKIWMIIDAVRRQVPYYWFLIVIFVPFGDFVYFAMVKMKDMGAR
jgi:hypothetical protein